MAAAGGVISHGGLGRWHRSGRRSIDIRGTSKEHIWFDMDQVRAGTPHILSIINDSYHLITTRKHRPRKSQRMKQIVT